MQNFENALAKLEQLVEKIETGKLNLEETLRCFEQGVQLAANCQKTLTEAEQRITEVTQKNGSLFEAPIKVEYPTEDAS